MKIAILLCFLVVVLYVQAEADPDENESESALQRSARAITNRASRLQALARRARVKKVKRAKAQRARRRRFRTRRNKHGRQYYERMMGLRTPPDYWRKTVKTNIYNGLQNAFRGQVLPRSFRWTDKPGIVTPAKLQGDCGSCYSFTAVGALESMLAIWSKKRNLDLSEQEIVDCSQSAGNFGCNGGLTENVFQWLSSKKYLTWEHLYPYRGVLGQCRRPTTTNSIGSMTFAQIPFGIEDGLRRVVYHLGPVAIGIHANITSMFDYQDGIYDDPGCNTAEAQVDHGVLLVGWGEENGVPYWLVKNSWGTDWGDNGFMKIRRGRRQCKIGQMASVPVLQWVADKLKANQPARYTL